ncbi:hypothetical protein BVX98_06350 [bacterium F11]|nr:hypothetical protein BVX98_06350 [bacterium F11]
MIKKTLIISLSTLFILAGFKLSIAQQGGASHVEVVKSSHGWSLTVDGLPYIIKGVSYSPVTVGQSPAQASQEDWMEVDVNNNGRNDFAYDSFVDTDGNNRQTVDEPRIGDFQLLENMGVNTIRLYHHASDDDSVIPGYNEEPSQEKQYEHPPNKALLRELYDNHGIRVAMGDLLGAYTVGAGVTQPNIVSYSSETHKERMEASVRQMVMDFKDEPYLLMYILGNENNYAWTNNNAYREPRPYVEFVHEMAELIHTLDGKHPVAVCVGDLGPIDMFAKVAQERKSQGKEDYIDIYGSNNYRNRGEGFQDPFDERGFFHVVKMRYDKPILLTEFGDLEPVFENGDLDEANQEEIHKSGWEDIARNMAHRSGEDNVIGGFVFAWLDNWWQGGDPGGHAIGALNEWHGIASQGNGSSSPYLRKLRPVYDYYDRTWSTPLPPPIANAGDDQRAVDNPGDGDLNEWDRLVIENALNTQPHDNGWVALADLNGDQRIDQKDLDKWDRAKEAFDPSPNWNEDADINKDGRVDALDANILLSVITNPPGIPEADIDGNGTVNVQDFVEWKKARFTHGPGKLDKDADINEIGYQEITLDGTGSRAADGDIVSYVWREMGTIIDRGAVITATFTVGVHLVTLEVEDSNGNKSEDLVIVAIDKYEPVPPKDNTPQPALGDTGASVVTVDKQGNDWVLLVDGEPYEIRGVSYSPAQKDQSPNLSNLQDWMVVDINNNGRNDFGYDSFVDANKNNLQDADELSVGDFQLMKEMGVNTIRQYHHASNHPIVQPGYHTDQNQHTQFNHSPRMDVMDDLYETYGIRIAIGDFIGAKTIGSGVPYPDDGVIDAVVDYENPLHRDTMRASVFQMVMDFRDKPFLLMYILGNENNYDSSFTNAHEKPRAYVEFVHSLAEMINDLDPNHPVAVCVGDLGPIDMFKTVADERIQQGKEDHIDIYGSNNYRNRGGGFRDPIDDLGFFNVVKERYDKPVLMTEFGDLEPEFVDGQLNEAQQLQIHRTGWMDIKRNMAGIAGAGNAIGGFAFSWLDKWWPEGKHNEHDLHPEEYHGIASQADGELSPYIRQLRDVYYYYQSAWSSGLVAMPGANQEITDIIGDNYIGQEDVDAWIAAKFSNINSPNWNETADINGDGVVDVSDINEIIAAKESRGPAGNYDSKADANGDGSVDVVDFNIINSARGSTFGGPGYTTEADVSGDGKVDEADIVIWNTFKFSRLADDNWNSRADINGEGIEKVTLDGSQSYDLTGTITSYQWILDSRTPIGNKPRITVSLPVGEYTITLLVQNDRQQSAQENTHVTIRPAEPIPVAAAVPEENESRLMVNAGKEQFITLREVPGRGYMGLTTLEGDVSRGGEVVKKPEILEWSFRGCEKEEACGEVSIYYPNSLKTGLNIKVPGIYRFMLLALSDGELATDEVKVNLLSHGIYNLSSLASLNGFNSIISPIKRDLRKKFNPNNNNETGEIGFGLSETGWVTITIKDRKGDLVRRLISANYSAGEHVVEWDGKSDSQVIQASGFYRVYCEVDGHTHEQKLIISK